MTIFKQYVDAYVMLNLFQHLLGCQMFLESIGKFGDSVAFKFAKIE